MSTDQSPGSPAERYQRYSRALQNRPLPAAALDLGAFDANNLALQQRARPKQLRLASKSIRVPALMQRVLASSPQWVGLMTYRAAEAAWLHQAYGFDNLLMGYPEVEPQALRQLAELNTAGARAIAMVDLPEQVARAEDAARDVGAVLPVCLDLDCSLPLPGLWFGVKRSRLRQPEQVVALARQIADSPHLKLHGLMGYEAQLAGLPDRLPGQGLKNAAVRLLQQRSRHELARRRSAVLEALEQAGHHLELVNGGGTGSLESTGREARITESTAGSGLLTPTLFDHYGHFRHHPAAFYALRVTRQPDPNIYTCAGGGYPASGPTDSSKSPEVYLPPGARLLPNEGAGEVQTPVAYSGELALGDIVCLRHAKAGEQYERFNSVLLLEGDQVVDEAPTYRGLGKHFI